MGLHMQLARVCGILIDAFQNGVPQIFIVSTRKASGRNRDIN